MGDDDLMMVLTIISVILGVISTIASLIAIGVPVPIAIIIVLTIVGIGYDWYRRKKEEDEVVIRL